ncbi:MAG: Hpt domain-containing protein, partial [Treponema sp.]|nr:Hpt domain-containing protein [Treponema sp.]
MSDYLDPNNEELLKDFFSEAQMQVDTLEQNVLVLENESGNRDAIDEIFRAAHTLKGGSATVEMMELSHFTHLVEDVLDAIRSDQLTVNEDVVDTLLAAIDIIKLMLAQRMEGAVYQDDTSQIEGRLSALLPEDAKSKKGGARAPAKPAAKAPPPPPPPAASAETAAGSKSSGGGLSEYDLLELRQSVDGNTPIYQVSVQFNENGLMNTVGGIQVYASLKSAGTVLRTSPDFEQLYEDNFFPTVDYYFATTKTVDEIKKYVSIPDVTLSADIKDISQLTPETAAAGPAPAASAPAPQAAAPAPAAPKAAAPAAPAEKAPPAAKAAAAGSAEDAKKAGKEAGSILRVDSKRIDDLLNLVSETVITKATFNQINNQFNDLVNDLHELETRYRDKIKSLFDNLPDYLESIQGGKSVKDVRKEINEEYGDIFSLFDSFETSVKTNVGKFRSTSQ